MSKASTSSHTQSSPFRNAAIMRTRVGSPSALAIATSSSTRSIYRNSPIYQPRNDLQRSHSTGHVVSHLKVTFAGGRVIFVGLARLSTLSLKSKDFPSNALAWGSALSITPDQHIDWFSSQLIRRATSRQTAVFRAELCLNMQVLTEQY